MNEIITDEMIEFYFNLIKEHLTKTSSRITFQLSREWFKTFPKDAGVYCFFIDDQLRYVGETGCLKKKIS